MNIKHIVAALLIVSSASIASAQTTATATQKFKVIVPANISITAPANVVITHDQTDNDQAFPPQQWTVRGNTLAGVAVSFSTQSPFVHTTDPTFKRDAQLSLGVGPTTGPATWNITTASDATNYLNADDTATVTASSSGIGKAVFQVNMKFLTNGFGTFAAGDYESTVVGTVTSN